MNSIYKWLFILLSANALNFDQSKILLFDVDLLQRM